MITRGSTGFTDETGMDIGGCRLLRSNKGSAPAAVAVAVAVTDRSRGGIISRTLGSTGDGIVRIVCPHSWRHQFRGCFFIISIIVKQPVILLCLTLLTSSAVEKSGDEEGHEGCPDDYGNDHLQ